MADCVAEVEYIVDRSKSAPAYRQLETQLIEHIASGGVSAGDRLEPETSLSAKLGISRMTVSNAYRELEQRGYVARFRGRGTFVLSHAERRAARGTLTVVMEWKGPRSPTPLEQDYLAGFQQECAARGYTTAVSFTPDLEQAIDPQGSKAVAILAQHMPKAPLPRCPVVFFMGWTDGTSNVDWVHTDSVDGGRRAAEHLASLGHKRLGIFVRSHFHAGIDERIKGFRRGADRAGIAEVACVMPKEARTPPVQELTRLLQRPDRPTGVFCMCDPGGLQVMHVARDLGLRVPEDLSVLSYDGSSLTELSTPKLTSIYPDRVRAGERAAEILIGRIEGSIKGPPRHVITPVSLRVRESTTAPPSTEDSGRSA